MFPFLIFMCVCLCLTSFFLSSASFLFPVLSLSISNLFFPPSVSFLSFFFLISCGVVGECCISRQVDSGTVLSSQLHTNRSFLSSSHCSITCFFSSTFHSSYYNALFFLPLHCHIHTILRMGLLHEKWLFVFLCFPSLP